MGKVRSRITSNMDAFYAVNVLVSEKVFLDSSAYILSLKVIKISSFMSSLLCCIK